MLCCIGNFPVLDGKKHCNFGQTYGVIYFSGYSSKMYFFFQNLVCCLKSFQDAFVVNSLVWIVVKKHHWVTSFSVFCRKLPPVLA